VSGPWPISRRLLLGQSLPASLLFAGLLRSFGVRAAPLSSSAPIAHAPAHGGSSPPRPIPLVVLDPGHGGKDPGAIGVSGTYEKHIALAAAFELKRRLEADRRYRVVMTRGEDVFIPLDARVARAEAIGASLFVSMHADALPDHEVRGASVYTLSTTASDTQTAALARRENSADRFGGPQFHGASPEVAQILASLVRQETRIGSARMARSLVSQLDQDVPMLPNPARHAAFVVLKATDVPSVLVEMGFMSNPKDEAALRRPAHRTQVAAAMKRAVDAYFEAATHAAGIAG
jgi:N-acetylmuramoyl-L-alanine amidase